MVAEWRRIVHEGTVLTVRRDGEHLVAGDGRRFDISAVSHLPPVDPRKILAVHFNYRSRVQEMGRDLPPAPTYFSKLATSVVGHRGAVIRPPGCEYLNYEGEVAAVIGVTTRGVSREDAAACIRGYTIANDFGLHDFRDTDWGSMLRVKGSDTMCPLGPGVVTGWDPRGKGIRTSVNGAVVQEGNVDEMEWPIDYLIADLARSITLEPGDVVLTGTPAHSRPVEPGDVVVVEVEGLGALENPVEQGVADLAGVGAQPARTQNVRSVALGSDYRE